jgi:hypothetical protein
MVVVIKDILDVNIAVAMLAVVPTMVVAKAVTVTSCSLKMMTGPVTAGNP